MEDAHNCGANLQEITRRRIGSSRIMTANNLNEIPLCGFTPADYKRYTWFVPNHKCLAAWFEISGFEAEAVQVIPSRLLNSKSHGGQINGFADMLMKFVHRYKNRIRNARRRATIIFRARHVGTPKREMDIPGMHHFEIPTKSELEKAKTEIAQLQDRLQMRGDA
jgi:hypothetical protein